MEALMGQLLKDVDAIALKAKRGAESLVRGTAVTGGTALRDCQHMAEDAARLARAGADELKEVEAA